MADVCLQLQNVTKKFGSTIAVDHVNLEILKGEFFSLLGPSGCGKTTLLRLIAGFEISTAGKILMNGQDIASLPPYQRPVNTVFQHYSLFPHMNVSQNIAFGLEQKGVPRNSIGQTVEEALEMVRLSGFEKRRPSQLSGGQKQRVALARALVLHPQILLLDEPLGALDMKLRKEMQVELKNLQEELKITFIFVTHDQEEALVMSDRIAVMNTGKVQQVGQSCTDVFERPRTVFVANFMGATNLFEGIVSNESGRTLLRMADGPSFELDSPVGSGTVNFTVRPEKMLLTNEPVDGCISVPVMVQDEIYQGTNTNWVVDYRNHPITVIEQNTKVAEEKARFSRGDRAYLSWNPKNTIILED